MTHQPATRDAGYYTPGQAVTRGHAYAVGQPEQQTDGRWAIELVVGS